MSAAENKLTMDRVPVQLETIAEFLATANGRLSLLRDSSPGRDDIFRELAVIQAEIQASLIKINDLRTLAQAANWRIMATANGVHLPEQKE